MILETVGNSAGVATISSYAVEPPLLWLKFNDNIGTTTITNSGYATLTPSTSTANNQSGVFKFGGGGLSVSPSKQYYVALSPDTLTTNKLSIKFWLYPTTINVSSYQSIFRIFFDNGRSTTIGFFGSSFGMYETGNQYAAKPSSFKTNLLNKWSFFEVVFDASTVRVFVDGQLQFSDTSYSADITGANVMDLLINGYVVGAEQITGYFDDFVIETNLTSVPTTNYTAPTTEYIPLVSAPSFVGLLIQTFTSVGTSITDFQQIMAAIADALSTGSSTAAYYIVPFGTFKANSYVSAIADYYSPGYSPGYTTGQPLTTAGIGGVGNLDSTSTSTASSASALEAQSQQLAESSSASASSYELSASSLQSGSASAGANSSINLRGIKFAVANSIGYGTVSASILPWAFITSSAASSSLAFTQFSAAARHIGAAQGVATPSFAAMGYGHTAVSSSASSALDAQVSWQRRSLARATATGNSASYLFATGSLNLHSYGSTSVIGRNRWLAKTEVASSNSVTAFGYARATAVQYAYSSNTSVGLASFRATAAQRASAFGYTQGFIVTYNIASIAAAASLQSFANGNLGATSRQQAISSGQASNNTRLGAWAAQRGIAFSESDLAFAIQATSAQHASAISKGSGFSYIIANAVQTGSSVSSSALLAAAAALALQRGTSVARTIANAVGGQSVFAKAIGATVVSLNSEPFGYVSFSGTALVNTASIALVDGSSLARVSDTTVIESINTDIYNGLVVATPGAITVIDGARVLVPFGYVFGRATIDKVSQSTIPGYGDITISTLPASTTRTRPTDADQLRIIRQKADPTPKKSIVS